MKKSNLCKTICLLASVAFLLVSCATPQTKTGKGGAYGAAGGAVAGAIIGQVAGKDTKIHSYWSRSWCGRWRSSWCRGWQDDGQPGT